MSTQTQQLLLKQFFSAYFHEDWQCEVETPADAVSEYARTVSSAEAHRLAAAIKEFAESAPTDAELESRLFRELGCYYRPAGVGLSVRDWLEQVATQLRDSNGTLGRD